MAFAVHWAFFAFFPPYLGNIAHIHVVIFFFYTNSGTRPDNTQSDSNSKKCRETFAPRAVKMEQRNCRPEPGTRWWLYSSLLTWKHLSHGVFPVDLRCFVGALTNSSGL